MAIIRKLNKRWDAWVKTRPKNIQVLCHKFPPNKLYLLKTSNHRVTVYSYSEDNTLTVDVTGEYNKVAFDRHVFGVKPEDLEECNLPHDDELLGTTLTTDKNVEKFIDTIRPLVVKEKQI